MRTIVRVLSEMQCEVVRLSAKWKRRSGLSFRTTSHWVAVRRTLLRPVTPEVASSNLVGPAIHKGLRPP